jgi:hypothetical protein
MVKETGMPKGKDMEASKVESPTLVPEETAEEQEARELMESEAETVDTETVLLKDAETAITNDVETVRSGIDALAEVELTGEDAVEDDAETVEIESPEVGAPDVRETEEPEQMEQAMASAESEADTVDRTPSILTSRDSFDALVSRAEEVGMADLADVSYQQYSEMASRLASVQQELDSASFFKKMFGLGSLKVELSQLNNRMEAFDRLAEQAEIKDFADANPQAQSEKERVDTSGSRDRTAKASKIGNTKLY